MSPPVHYLADVAKREAIAESAALARELVAPLLKRIERLEAIIAKLGGPIAALHPKDPDDV